jgi:rubrerythrin
MEEKESRQCNQCGESWTCTGDDECPFCGSDDTEPVEDEDLLRMMEDKIEL